MFLYPCVNVEISSRRWFRRSSFIFVAMLGMMAFASSACETIRKRKKKGRREGGAGGEFFCFGLQSCTFRLF